MAENVKVAVRVRPFNEREKKRKASLVVQMEENLTSVQNPKRPDDNPRTYKFDYSYWSHDGYVERDNGYLERDDPSSKYCDQNRIFEDLGEGILRHAWEGYNSTLFAYGQTGSGKSYSIVGHKENKGIVRVLSDRLFAQMAEKSGDAASGQFEVTLSMLEIYSEQVRDLLIPATIKAKKGMRVREHPNRGFYVELLRTVAVESYADIRERMAEGIKNRTIAATNMNKTSSRAHTVVGISFVQKTKNDAGKDIAKTSTINLVDLAGSERAKRTRAAGERLKEGAKINLSLTSLGKVIKALAEQSAGKNVKVPYRDSVLTKILKNALGGNSKTVMVAAISPADKDYDETISTLEYAKRAKEIKTVAKVNEDPIEKLIRELQEENKKMKEKLAKDGSAALIAGKSEELTEAEERLKAAMAENERKIRDLEQSWQEKLDLARKEHGTFARKELEAKMRTTAHLYNLNADPQMCKVLVHILEKGEEYIVGKPADDVKIPLMGAGIVDQHALIRVKENGVFLKILGPDAKVRFNGEPLFEGDETQLRQNDRVLFGASHLYVFHDPIQYNLAPKSYPEVSYDKAQDEILISMGLSSAVEKSKADAFISEVMTELRPAIDEANCISEELDQKVKFELLVVPPLNRGVDTGFTEIMVRMRHLINNMAWVWSREEFVDRKFMMQEMYEKEDSQAIIADENNPFVGDANADVLIASAEVSPECLAHMIHLKQQIPLVGFGGENCGVLNASLTPLDSNGKEIDEEDNATFVDNPEEMIGKKYKVKVKVDGARGLPKQFKDVYVKYDMYLEENKKTKIVNGTVNPDFKYEEIHQFHPVTSELIKWMKKGKLIFQVRGKQQPITEIRRKMTTRKLSQAVTLAAAESRIQTQPRSMWKVVNIDKILKCAWKRRCGIAEKKLHDLLTVVTTLDEKNVKIFDMKVLKQFLTEQQLDSVDQMIKKIAAIQKENKSSVCLVM